MDRFGAKLSESPAVFAIDTAAPVGVHPLSIPAVKYNMTILGVVTTDRLPWRGGSQARSFDYQNTPQEPSLTVAGRVEANTMWERIDYFLERVVPVAEEYRIRMACHPHDPGMPRPQGFRGIDRVLGNVEGLKKFIDLRPELRTPV